MIATGKELAKQQIADFSRQKEQRREDAQTLILRRIESENIGRKASADKNALWLMDDWCGKGIRGRILMPFSRH